MILSRITPFAFIVFVTLYSQAIEAQLQNKVIYQQNKTQPLRIALHPLNFSQYQQHHKNGSEMSEMISSLLMIKLGKSQQFELLDRSLISALLTEKVHLLVNDDLNTKQAIFKKLPISDFTLVGSLFSSADGEFFSLKLVNNRSGQILGATRLAYTIDTLQNAIQQAESLIQQWITQTPLTAASNVRKIAFGHFIDISASDTMLNQGQVLTESLIEQFVNEKKQVVLSRTQMFPLLFEEYLRALQYSEESQSLQRQNTDYFIHGKYRVNDSNSKKTLSIYLYFDLIKYGRELVVLQAENWEQAYTLVHQAITDLLPEESTHISTKNIEASNKLLLEALQVRGTIPKINLRDVLAGKRGPSRWDIENFFFSAKNPEKLAPARKLIEQALEKNPDNSFANLILALFFETEGDTQRSWKIINKVVRQKEAMSVDVAFEMLQLRKRDAFSRINEKTFAGIVGEDQSTYVYQWLIKNKYLFKGAVGVSRPGNPRMDQIMNLSHTVFIDSIDLDKSIQVLEFLRSIRYSSGLQVKYSKPRSRHRLYKNKRNWRQSSYRDKHNIESVMHFEIGKTASLMLINDRSSLSAIEFFDEVTFESKERRHANLEIAADAFSSSVYIDTSYLKAKIFLGYSLCQEAMPRCASANIIHDWVVDQTKAANLKSVGGMYFNVTKDIEEKDRLIFLAADAVNRVHEANFTKMFQNTLISEKYYVKRAEKNLISLSENEQKIASDSDLKKSALSYAKLIKAHCVQLTKRQEKLGLWAPLTVTKPMDDLTTLALHNNNVALLRKALLADLETNCPHVYPHIMIRASAVAPFVLEEQDDIISKVASGKIVPFKISRFMQIVLEIFEARVDSQQLETAKQYIQYLTDYYHLNEQTAMDFAYLYYRIGDSKTSDRILHDYAKTAFKVSLFSRLNVDGDYVNKGFNHNGLLKFVHKENNKTYFLYGVNRARYGLAEIPVKWGLTIGDKQSRLISGNKNSKHPAAFGFGNGGKSFGEMQWTASVLIKGEEKEEAMAADSEIYPEITLLKQQKLSFPEQSLKRNMPGSYFIDSKNKTSISGFPRGETAGPLLDSYFSDTFAQKIKPNVIKEALFKKGYLSSAGIPVGFEQDLPKRLQKDFPEYSRDLRRALNHASHIKESGYVQIYQQKGDAWELEASLAPEDAIKQRHFGLATAISGQYALICDNKDGIYSYRKINNRWLQQQRIESACNKIVMNDAWAIVGAKEKAFVYKNNNGFWQKTQVLTPKNYLINKDKRYNFERFAYSLAIYQGTIAIGNALGGIYTKGKVSRLGEVYLFTLSDNQWQQSEIIRPKQNAYNFGESIVLTENFMLIGDTSTGGSFKSPTYRSGSVFMYRKENSHWKLNAQLVAKGKPRQERFGQYLLLIDDSLLIKSFKNIYRYPLKVTRNK